MKTYFPRVLKTQNKLRKAKHVAGLFFKCCKCEQILPAGGNGAGTGYGYFGDGSKVKPVCYECCGKQDRDDMIASGKATLYLTCEPARNMRLAGGRKTAGKVSNWPGTLIFNCHTRVGRHNIAGVRYDCWFKGPDGFTWHGVTIGENNQICRCKRTKERR